MGRDEVDQCESCLQEAYVRERQRCEAEMQKLRRMVRWLAEYLADAEGDDEITPEHWIWQAEQAVANEISPKA